MFKEHISILLTDVKVKFEEGFELLREFRDRYNKPKKSLLRQPQEITKAENITKRAECLKHVFRKIGDAFFKWEAFCSRVKGEKHSGKYLQSLEALAEYLEKYRDIWVSIHGLERRDECDDVPRIKEFYSKMAENFKDDMFSHAKTFSLIIKYKDTNFEGDSLAALMAGISKLANHDDFKENGAVPRFFVESKTAAGSVSAAASKRGGGTQRRRRRRTQRKRKATRRCRVR